jgi:hypothetical protein
MKRLITLALSLLPLWMVSPVAHAHLRMAAPAPRHGGDGLKVGPCGEAASTRGEQVTTLRPGSTLRPEWDETISHPSHYRISFDPDGHDDFEDPPEMQAYESNDAVLLDAIPNEGGPHFVRDVELPDVECERCTLQLIQVMYDKPPYEVGGNDIYYQCADLVLSRSAPEGAAGEAESSAATSGCTVAGRSPGGSLLVALALWLRRRRGALT